MTNLARRLLYPAALFLTSVLVGGRQLYAAMPYFTAFGEFLIVASYFCTGILGAIFAFLCGRIADTQKRRSFQLVIGVIVTSMLLHLWVYFYSLADSNAWLGLSVRSLIFSIAGGVVFYQIGRMDRSTKQKLTFFSASLIYAWALWYLPWYV